MFLYCFLVSRCHLDFSSTKYNEEIRHIVTHEIDKAICEDGVIKPSSDSLLSAELYIIGGNCERENERLRKVMEKLEDWATPYECYRIAIIERSSKAKAEVLLQITKVVFENAQSKK